MSKVDFEKVWAEACDAFAVAYEGEKPPKFVVGEEKVMFGNEIDYAKPVYVMEGLCGFAWVNVGDGRSAWAKWLKKNHGGYNEYYGGVAVWSRQFGRDNSQSVDRKVAGCQAAVDVFKKYGLPGYVCSRLD